MYAENTPILEVDRKQAIAHLKVLGYQQDDTVYVRYIHSAKKQSIKRSKLDFVEADRYQVEGYDVYFVINGGGDTDSAVTKCRAIFYEHDDLDKQSQLLLWQTLGLPEPTIQIDTGGRSIHSYWVFTERIDTPLWKELQADLLEYSKGDRKLKNPSRILRLAGGCYMKGKQPGTTAATIVSQSEQRYNYAELRALIPKLQQQEQPALLIPPISRHEEITIPVFESVPLEVCLSKASRDSIKRGALQGDRNNSGAALARDLIGTANYLQSIGQRFDGDPWQLFLHYCHRCPSGDGWNENEYKSIWKSALGDNPTPSCRDNGVETCIRAWYWKNYIKPTLPARRDRTPSLSSNSSGLNSPSSGNSTVSNVCLRDRVIEILNRNLSPAEQKQAFIDLGRSTGYQLREIEHLADLIESDAELVEGRSNRVKELDSLIKIGDRRLTLSKYLHPTLAQPLEQLAIWMGVDAEALLILLLPTAASLLHPEMRVIVKECIDFVEPMVVYAGIISESGNRKSPIFKAITKPLRKLQEEEDIRQGKAQRQYQEDLKAWKRNTSENKGEPPEPPRPPREYFVDNITGEALDRIKAQQPQHGILIRKDELSGLFSSYGAYKGGRGSDKESILSGWNGGGVKVNRVGGSRLSLSHDASSIVGAIQPGKLRKLMGDFEDEQGEWGRFLWYIAPLRLFQLPDEDTCFEVGDLLESIYRQLDRLAPIQYRFTPDAQRLYQKYHSQLEQRKIAESHQGMRAAIAKMEGYTARIAGILHVLWEIAAGQTPDQRIPIERVKAAKALAEFYLGQVLLIYTDGEAAQGKLTPILAEILKKAKIHGCVTARNLQQSIKALKKTSAQKVREYLCELAKMGYGKIEGEGNRIKFIPKTVDQQEEAETLANSVAIPIEPLKCRPTVDPTVDQNPISKNLHVSGFQPDFNSNCRPVDHLWESPDNPEVVSQTVELDLESGEEDSLKNNGQQGLQIYTMPESFESSKFVAVDQGTTLGSTVDLDLDEPLKVGDRVIWDNCPSHCHWANPFTIRSVEGDRAMLEWYMKPVPIGELRLAIIDAG